MKTLGRCPCCQANEIVHLTDVDDFAYFRCPACESIFINSSVLEEIDQGRNLRAYDLDYWQNELSSSRERSYGVALARMAEAFYYTRIPIGAFLDIGTGPGYFLDAVAKYLPGNSHIFYGVEKFPPISERRTHSPNYIIGELNDIDIKVDGGICIEVIEHITPKMLQGLLQGLARVSNSGALYIFNTGMPNYVLHEDMNYLDPLRRGHIVSYSLKAVECLADGLGFTVLPIIGKTWAFALEYDSKSAGNEDIRSRAWSALKHNLELLDDREMGSVLKVLGLETIRAYAP